PQPYAGKLASLRTLAGGLTAEITLLEAAIADLLAHHDGYHASQALPGIGPGLATLIVAGIGGITRFDTKAPPCTLNGLSSTLPPSASTPERMNAAGVSQHHQLPTGPHPTTP